MIYGLKVIAVAIIMSVAVAAQAAETDIFKLNGQYGQTGYVYNNGSWVAAGVAVDGAGQNETAVLYYSVYNYSAGTFSYWRNNIPVEAVTVNGINYMSVAIDTCTISAVAGCGYVELVLDTIEPAAGWVNNGVWGYDYSGYIFRAAGSSVVRSATAVGTVLGVAVNSDRGYIGTLDDVTVEISTGL